MAAVPSLAALKARSVARHWPELNRQVIRGTSNGRVIWQPRILAWWDDRIYFNDLPMPEPYDRLTQADMFRYLDCSTRVYDFNACFSRVEHRAVQFKSEDLGNGLTRTVIKTPVGEQSRVDEMRPTCRAAIAIKHEIETKEDLRIATWRAENAHYEYSQETYDRLMIEVGDLGLPTMYVPRPNVQDLYINTMGTQEGIYALYDWGEEAFRPYFRALDALDEQLMNLLNTLPQFEYINFGDNIHGATLSPALFEKYVLPVYHRRCAILHKTGKFVHAHWDGEVRQLLRFAKYTHLDGIEAITPKPQGDVTLEEVKEALGDKVFLLDGIPALYFDPVYSIDTLVACAQEIIRLFAPKLILGISDEMSSTGEIERVRVVGQVVDEYNASCPNPV